MWTFNTYQDACQVYEKSIGTDWYYVLGLTGEAGEVAEIIKKSYRVEPYRKPVNADALALELGDVLWYLARLAAQYRFSLQEIANRNLRKLEDRRAAGSH